MKIGAVGDVGERPKAGKVLDGERKAGIPWLGGVKGIDIVADIIKWLEYDVLCTELADGAPTWGEAALFGMTAAVSSQVYKDSSMYFGLGSAEDREAVLRRGRRGWLTTYSKQAVSTAALFGVYESVRTPLAGILQGGAANCVGSSRPDVCIDSFAVGGELEVTKDMILKQLAQWIALVTQLDL